MFGWIVEIYKYISSIWLNMPDSSKEKVIDSLLDAFDEILRGFFKSNKSKSDDENEKS
jgi:hypothetical protein